ncbi:hypothetical protein ANO11243_075490 [Dothideomycetidae sp. 11243]|nr:hypothetical protein ANO11243_075490 [fungal sp. No.11243]
MSVYPSVWQFRARCLSLLALLLLLTFWRLIPEPQQSLKVCIPGTGRDCLTAPAQHQQQEQQHHEHHQQVQQRWNHPIKQLHDRAMESFTKMINRQSKTLDQAIHEYEHRYGRAPPLGFDKWFEFAKEKDSAIVDDFDTIAESLQFLWHISPADIEDNYRKASAGGMVHTLTFESGQGTASVENWMGEDIIRALDEAKAHIPDFHILMNLLDEPRVLLAENKPVSAETYWNSDDMDSAWPRISGTCDANSAKFVGDKRPNSDIDTYSLPFVTDIRTAKDVCKNPSYSTQHGFMMHPPTLITTSAPAAILSQAKTNTFSDILYPSMLYFTSAIWTHDEADMPWSDKLNKVYWAGSTTGMYTRLSDLDSPTAESHRHRFIRLTNNPHSKKPHTFLSQSDPSEPWTAYKSSDVLSPLYDTKFTSSVQCDDDACAAQESLYRFAAPEPQNTSFANRFLMDIDGNSFSGRFYNFLQSRSCPLKMTLFKEWHDDRLVPWVHYVPISVGMEDLPEIVRWLALTGEGQEVAERIARMGTEWHARFLRMDDAAVYLFRLFLEYARVVHPERDSGRMDLRLVGI